MPPAFYMENTVMKKNKTLILLFMAPTVVCLLLMYVYPVIRTVVMSFFKVEDLTSDLADWRFYGLANYVKIFHNAGFITSMKNFLAIWIVGGVITLALAMLMAVILTSGIRFQGFFRAAIYLPNVVSAVALATMWVQYIFNYDYGLLNQLVSFLGFDKIRWMGTDTKLWAMIAAYIYGSIGYYMLIYISGIESIPTELFEAATIDGAGLVTRFFRITLPLQKGIIKTTITFWTINAATFYLWSKLFSPVQTEGSTIVPVVYLYDTVFGGKGVVTRDAGAGAAVGVVLTVIIIAVYLVTERLLKSNDLEY